MSVIPYPAGKQFQLWVRDTGKLDTFGVFVNGQLVERVSDQAAAHKFPIQRPAGATVVVVHFGGNDFGVSAIVDVTDSNERALEKLTPTDGARHSYVLQAV